MNDTLSGRILNFIGSMPHCLREQSNRDWVVRRLTDGALISEPLDAEHAETWMLVVEWAKAVGGKSLVPGQSLAALEIEAGVRHWVATGG